MISAIACLSVSAKTVYPVGDWVYEKINNETEFEIDAYSGTSASASTSRAHNGIPITAIGTNAFSNNTTLNSIKINTPIISVKSFAFLNCTNLETVTLSSTVNVIGTGAFSGCSSLETINIEDTSISSVNSSAFSNCSSLSEVILPDTVESIKSYAFADCDNLVKITIPASVTSIDAIAFSNSDNVVIYCYTNSTAHTYAVDNDIEYVLLDYVETYILGDADNDGIVSVLDATEVQRLLAELITDEDGKIQIRGNVDCDEVLDITDATAIQRFLAEYDDGLMIGQTFEY